MLFPGNIFLLLGSNLGDRSETLLAAREFIAAKVGTVVSQSSIYETEPWGLTDQPAFLNQVIEIDSDQEPEEILRNILDIEHQLGRERYERWGARVIDIDLLYFKDMVLDSARLTLPHPRIQDRRFTLIPLTEIAADFVHPIFRKSNTELLEVCPDHSEVVKFS